MALLATNSFLLVVLVIHYIQVVWELYTVDLSCMPVVMRQVSQLGSSELGFYFQVFQVLSLLLLSLYNKSKVVVWWSSTCSVGWWWPLTAVSLSLVRRGCSAMVVLGTLFYALV